MRRRIRLNPPVYYRAEKGNIPTRLDSAWIEHAPAARDLSNTCWGGGMVDFAGKHPRVAVDDTPLHPRDCARGPGKKLLTYLLNEDRWEPVSGDPRPANGRIPMVSVGQRSVPAGYALAVRYDVPVMLVSSPELRKNPRGWFAGWGHAVGVGRAGTIRIVHGHKGSSTPLYEYIVIHDGSRRTRPGEVELT